MTSKSNSLKRASAASIQGIINSCCPFIATASKEGPGSPPYSRDIRLRIHNWSNSLSGASKIPRDIPASDKETPGLPEFSRESSAVAFVKSAVSLEQTQPEDEFTVLLEARPSPTSDHSVNLAEDADSLPLESDWQTERGDDEVLVALTLQKKQSDGETDMLKLEAKEATTALLERRQQHSPVTVPPPEELELLAMKPEPETPSSHELKDNEILIFNEDQELRRMKSSMEMFDALSHQPSASTTENSQHSSSTELLDIDVRAETAALQEIMKDDVADKYIDNFITQSADADANMQQPAEASQASNSAELLRAISKVRPLRSGKCRRSRMTSTRAPTPWSETQPEETVEDDGRLELAPSSTGESSYSSVEALADSNSYHTLSTTSASAEAQGEAAAAAETAEQLVMAEAAGDQPPPQADDGFNLRYFCGAFRPDDHEMSLTAALEEVSVAELREARHVQIPPFHSDSVVGRPADGRQRSERGASLSDVVLPLGKCCSETEFVPPGTDSSGVTLEAKMPSTYLPPEASLQDPPVH